MAYTSACIYSDSACLCGMYSDMGSVMVIIYDYRSDRQYCIVRPLSEGVKNVSMKLGNHPTDNQKRVIRFIEENLSIEFKGITKHDARDFISENIDASKEAGKLNRQRNLELRRSSNRLNNLYYYDFDFSKQSENQNKNVNDEQKYEWGWGNLQGIDPPGPNIF